jgi:hypothetical protein
MAGVARRWPDRGYAPELGPHPRCRAVVLCLTAPAQWPTGPRLRAPETATLQRSRRRGSLRTRATGPHACAARRGYALPEARQGDAHAGGARIRAVAPWLGTHPCPRAEAGAGAEPARRRAAAPRARAPRLRPGRRRRTRGHRALAGTRAVGAEPPLLALVGATGASPPCPRALGQPQTAAARACAQWPSASRCRDRWCTRMRRGASPAPASVPPGPRALALPGPRARAPKSGDRTHAAGT